MTANTTSHPIKATFKSFRAACEFLHDKHPDISYDVICEFVQKGFKKGEIVFSGK